MLIWVTVGGGDIRRSKPRDANDICQGYIRLSQVDRLGSVPLWMHCHDAAKSWSWRCESQTFVSFHHKHQRQHHHRNDKNL